MSKMAFPSVLSPVFSSSCCWSPLMVKRIIFSMEPNIRSSCFLDSRREGSLSISYCKHRMNQTVGF
ncbi:hypothetical protein SLEP1_g32194 [Rubroshorea leprosula]|uniref:Secreted protein n=1 Tax=Rubroshorea leprosula TaxID=152421 RepID=A0AAV5KCM4_9ROSI|nr:hypothetical protein SLEP1_g32194 [Rubroshorea leprosula]